LDTLDIVNFSLHALDIVFRVLDGLGVLEAQRADLGCPSTQGGTLRHNILQQWRHLSSYFCSDPWCCTICTIS
jgi:hypothetical protein